MVLFASLYFRRFALRLSSLLTPHFHTSRLDFCAYVMSWYFSLRTTPSFLASALYAVLFASLYFRCSALHLSSLTTCLDFCAYVMSSFPFAFFRKLEFNAAPSGVSVLSFFPISVMCIVFAIEQSCNHPDNP